MTWFTDALVVLKQATGTSLVVQWLHVWLSVQGMLFWSTAVELRSHMLQGNLAHESATTREKPASQNREPKSHNEGFSWHLKTWHSQINKYWGKKKTLNCTLIKWLKMMKNKEATNTLTFLPLSGGVYTHSPSTWMGLWDCLNQQSKMPWIPDALLGHVCWQPCCEEASGGT